MQKFHTDYRYTNRETKATYVWKKYADILKSSTLDVGADSMFLKPLVEEGGGSYKGVGFGEKLDKQIDLETVNLPYNNEQFHTVLCLDVLEHLESIHAVFAELCRVSSSYVIISLPNPFANFWEVLRYGDYSNAYHLKFYNLPITAPEDRHRWFFSMIEARRFLCHHADLAGFDIIQMDNENESPQNFGVFARLKSQLISQALKLYFRKDLDKLELDKGTLWCVLQRRR